MKHITLGFAAALFVLAGTANAQGPVENTVVTEDARAFFVVADPIQFAVVSGDLQAGPQGTFGRFPANFETPNHIHSHAYRAVVVSGEMTNPFKGEATSPVMKVGSYWSVAAGAEHSTACVSDTPCEFFMFADEGFDFTPVE
tara:strand:+ start:209 stop:634 length:426 start_codon:yes stop_codon:yes gene_type:complete